MTTSMGDGPDADSLAAYRNGYYMIEQVIEHFDPVGVVANEWAIRRRIEQDAIDIAAQVPGLEYQPQTPEILAVELLAAVADFVATDQTLKPLLMRRVEERRALFEQLYNQRVDHENAEDDDEWWN